MKTNWRQFFKQHTSAIFLLGGFIFDNFTLRRSDRLAENLVLLFYIIVSGLCIFLINDRRGESERVRYWLVAAMQFSFGNLFSAFLIFYSRSSALSASLPFLALFVVLMIGNEIFKKRYQQLLFQVGIWFFSLFSLMIFFVPVWLRHIGADAFLLSGAISLILAAIFIYLLNRLMPAKLIEHRRQIILVVALIYLVINGLYFANFIPPVPLVLKDHGVYHRLERVGNDYQVAEEMRLWWQYLSLYRYYHFTAGQTVYVYSAVFSPTDLDLAIVHHWQYFDRVKNRWQSAGRLSVPITGGREAGFRIYSYKTVLPGQWRVDIETVGGQVIGRVLFGVKLAKIAPKLEIKIK